MTCLQERANRRVFTKICVVSALFVVSGLLFTVLHAALVRAALLEQEQTFAASLLADGVAPETIARALTNTARSDAAVHLLSRLGRTGRTPLHLLAGVRRAIFQFLPAVMLCTLALALLNVGALLRFLCAREGLYSDAVATLRRFMEGDFSRHLPCAGTGTLYRFLEAADQLAAALKAAGTAEHDAKEFLKTAISDISHQLKTPLAALQMYHDILLAEAEDPAAVRAFAEKSQQSAARMERLTGMLLKVMRLDAGSVAFARERVTAQRLADRACAELLTRAACEGKRLTLSGDPALVLSCDPDWTAEALSNLVKNALDHTQPGGQVRLCWERSPAMLRFTVADDGCGIAPADLHHIFKRFYRSPASRDAQGVGLGLPLARAVAEGQGGVLSVRSVPGEGSVFTLSFPVEGL